MSIFRRSQLIGAAVAVLILSSCHGPPASRFRIGSGKESRDIRIEVVNDNYADMNIFLVGESSNFRLGNVTGKQTATFTLNPDRISPSLGFQLLADPVGSRGGFRSAVVPAGPGSVVVLNLHPDLAQSYITLR